MRRPKPAITWPRVLAQLVATGEVFEVTRGETLSPDSYAALVAGFGSAWVAWIEHPLTPSDRAGCPASEVHS